MSDPGFIFYADNFIGGTMFFTDAQVGRYMRALCAQKLNGHLTADELNSIIHEDPKILAKFATDSDGRYFNTRLQKEIDKRMEYSNKQRDRINKRWNKTDTAVLPGNKSGNTSDDTATGIGTDTAIDYESKKKMYLQEEKASYASLTLDTLWISEQQKYHPGLDILLSLEKAHVQFWGTDAGWEYTKRKRSKTKNWKRTYENALSQKINQVWLPRDQQQPDNIDKVCERMKREGRL